MSRQEAKQLVSEKEYLINEVKAEIKSEYNDGVITAMAGAQLEHNLIVSNLMYELNVCARKEGCLVLPSDTLLHLPSCKRYVYPDVMVVCEMLQVNKKVKNGLDAILNPSIIIEVMSPTTKNEDLGDKMQCYLELKSLKQYILIDSTKKYAMIYTRTTDKDWHLRTYSEDEDILEIENCALLLKKVYMNVNY